MPPTKNLAPKIRAEKVCVNNGPVPILKNISLDVMRNEVLAIIGPAGSGKTTFLRCMNRLIDLDPELSVHGKVYLDDADILAPDTDVNKLRRRVGIVFAVPAPLPMSIRENLTLGLRVQDSRNNGAVPEMIERSLRSAFLWEEVKDRLNESALKLSGGQQQRLCLARSLMVSPEVLLLDEPSSGLDPISTAEIEEALQSLKSEMSIVLVTNNVKQASRCSDRTAFLLMGELVEIGPTGDLFMSPRDIRTNDYVSGRYG